jgi:hypothetical protein
MLGVERMLNNTAAAWPISVAEAYIRANDLVATYKPSDQWPFSPQLYWQANALRSAPGMLASLSLLVSVQTHLLDTHPEIGTSTQLPSGEAFLLAVDDNNTPRSEQIDGTRSISADGETCCIVLRPKDWQYSYVELMHPSDFRTVTISNEAERISTEWQLFAEFLEKGVIRRARIHAAFLPRENDIELAANCRRAAQNLELPLTT